jgi:thiol-disulfide isomerase/thioredoxin
VILAAPLIALLLAGQAPPTPIRWQGSWTMAVQKAKAESKPLMIDFWADWCGFCHQLDRTTYRDAAVVGASRQFVAIKLNAEGSGAEERQMTSRYLVEALPTILFLTPHGRPVLRLNGYLAPQSFLGALAEAKRRADVVMALEAALVKDPKDLAALTALGQHEFHELSVMGENDARKRLSKFIFDDSNDLFTRACAVDGNRPAPERKHLRTTLGLLRGLGGKFPEAIAAFQESLAITPPDPEDARAYSGLGEMYALQGENKRARDTFQQLLRRYPQSEEAQVATQYLQKLQE